MLGKVLPPTFARPLYLAPGGRCRPTERSLPLEVAEASANHTSSRVAAVCHPAGTHSSPSPGSSTAGSGGSKTAEPWDGGDFPRASTDVHFLAGSWQTGVNRCLCMSTDVTSDARKPLKQSGFGGFRTRARGFDSPRLHCNLLWDKRLRALQNTSWLFPGKSAPNPPNGWLTFGRDGAGGTGIASRRRAISENIHLKSETIGGRSRPQIGRPKTTTKRTSHAAYRTPRGQGDSTRHTHFRRYHRLC